MSRTRAVDARSHAISPDWRSQLEQGSALRLGDADLIMNVEVLSERVASGGYGLIVRHEGGVVEQTGVPSIGLQGRG